MKCQMGFVFPVLHFIPQAQYTLSVSNSIKDLLIVLNLSDDASFELFHPTTRDRSDVGVLRCKKTGAIIVSTTNHISLTHYENQSNFEYWKSADRERSLQQTSRDDQRRAKAFKKLIKQAKWLDVGTGNGGILDLLQNESTFAHAVEPQKSVRDALIKIGHTVFSNTTEAKNNYYDVITLFHVLEHMIEPIEELRTIHDKLGSNGVLIVEIPHANDILLSLYDSAVFKKHTLWSEHLILHTQQTLRSFLKIAGFRKITIKPFQRYPLANHLHWLSKNKPGGQVAWNFLNEKKLDTAYAKKLAECDMTDTLIAYAYK